jgi:hypothetical protein
MKRYLIRCQGKITVGYSPLEDVLNNIYEKMLLDTRRKTIL